MNRQTNGSAVKAQIFIDRMAQGFIASHVLFVANEQKLFAFLTQPRTVEEVARKSGWPMRSAQKMLDALIATRLLEKTDGAYRNSPIAETCLVPGGPNYQGHIIRHLQDIAPLWLNLSDMLRTGQGTPIYNQQHNESLNAYILAMDDLAKPVLGRVLDELDLTNAGHMLDLGCGPATYAMAFLRRHPDLRATVFDQPHVLDITVPRIREAGLESRCATRGGNMLHDDIGTGYDCIFISNIIHFFEPRKNVELFAKCRNALNPGGVLAVKDFILDDERTGPPYALMFGLHMLLGTSEGATYSTAEIEDWGCEAGFQPGRAVPLDPQSRLWMAVK